ncbi:MAG: isoleucine--tRNA ligase [Elusimicrobia bacterium]|nr:isoleucine--tRNA ligase [Elusimicrobiota bacterium]
MATGQEPKSRYSSTVQLPQTEFPMRGDLAKREPQILELWDRLGVYERMQERAKGRPAYVLHDGPPYANGHIHIGHALNKVLKDAVVKSRALMGFRAPLVPGWDCHGLPIEYALLKEKKMSKRMVADAVAFRQEAAAFAENFIQLHITEFRRLGVFADWARPYKTMSRGYESAVLKAFRLLYKAGYIYRGRKTVSWCVTCETALAEAEVEYKPKTSPSVYVALPVLESALKELSGASVLVWTTTPWTLPANQAVAFHPGLDYVLADFEGRRLVVAQARLEAVGKALGKAASVLGTWKGAQLVESGLVCQTPFGDRPGFPWLRSRAVLADYVTAEDGTGVVHTAPGHGADDYLTAVREKLDIACPVDGAGRYTAELPAPFTGVHIFAKGKEGEPSGNDLVRALLTESGRLLASGDISHNYQHCWRCKNPIAFRATEQWFLRVSGDIRECLLEAVKKTRWVPAQGEERIAAMLGSRPDWCLSRQRLWGTPIPIFSCASCGKVQADDDALEAVERRVAEHGSDFWFADPGRLVAFGPGGDRALSRGSAASEAVVAADEPGAARWEFMPAKACPCGGKTFRRETDILDVWLDSGASWLAVLGEGEVPADLYLEGSDQHRGWFQSSLVPAVALTGKAPYKAVLTHGFVLDDKGRAMHKSHGNVVAPQEVVGKLGADVLRLWVALADYSDDVRLSAKLLEGPTEAYRKLRNTLKYLLGNTDGFDPRADAAQRGAMPELERFVLMRLGRLDKEVRAAYEAFEFRRAATLLLDFCNLTLSSFYLDARKDALYTLRKDDPARRAAQTVMWESLRRLLGLAAPILSFTCEEAWSEARRQHPGAGLAESVFLADLEPAPPSWEEPGLSERWERVLALRERVHKALEEARAAKLIGSSLAAKVLLSAADAAERELVGAMGAEAWAELCIVSEFELAGGEPRVAVEKAAGAKCPRCWRWRVDVNVSPEDPELCARCVRQTAA